MHGTVSPNFSSGYYGNVRSAELRVTRRDVAIRNTLESCFVESIPSYHGFVKIPGLSHHRRSFLLPLRLPLALPFYRTSIQRGTTHLMSWSVGWVQSSRDTNNRRLGSEQPTGRVPHYYHSRKRERTPIWGQRVVFLDCKENAPPLLRTSIGLASPCLGYLLVISVCPHSLTLFLSRPSTARGDGTFVSTNDLGSTFAPSLPVKNARILPTTRRE
ncbi:hypothetical protein EDB85DRAFT_641017 [Lactarius pseudohatsudake]|nr:hypothetical protein EDB85DRAFT_641017 [Lactarius pseudohatsudake]